VVYSMSNTRVRSEGCSHDCCCEQERGRTGSRGGRGQSQGYLSQGSGRRSQGRRSSCRGVAQVVGVAAHRAVAAAPRRAVIHHVAHVGPDRKRGAALGDAGRRVVAVSRVLAVVGFLEVVAELGVRAVLRTRRMVACHLLVAHESGRERDEGEDEEEHGKRSHS
ncbi:hypothetical protein PENTCL1PPCAC_30268, partial [Pristionchus entomophagus]